MRDTLDLNDPPATAMPTFRNLSSDELLQVEGGYFSDGSFASVLYLLFNAGKALV